MDIILTKDFIRETKEYLFKVLDDLEEYSDDDWEEVIGEMCKKMKFEFNSNELDSNLIEEFKENIIF